MTLDDLGNDGPTTFSGSSSENDNVHADIENVASGDKDDVLIGSSGIVNVLSGGNGRATDTAGNTDPTEATRTFTVNTTVMGGGGTGTGGGGSPSTGTGGGGTPAAPPNTGSGSLPLTIGASIKACARGPRCRRRTSATCRLPTLPRRAGRRSSHRSPS